MLIITGQTATGKTKLAIEYAKKYNGELINCDSKQVYKYLNIITGKDLKEISNNKFQISKKINHFNIGFYPISTSYNQSQPTSTKIWLYDIVEPNHSFSSFDWKKCTQEVIEDIKKRGKTPILVGGAYFYLKHLLYGFETENIPPNWQLRKELDGKSVKKLQEMLKKISPRLFKLLNESDRKNPHRLIRKIEIAFHFKTRLSPKEGIYSQIKKSNQSLTLQSNWQIIGLKFKDKNSLVHNIKKRVEKRLKNGALEEVKFLLKKGFDENDPGLKTIGYKQLISYLKGKLTKEEAINHWLHSEINYAKRQYTFMKKDPNIKWQEV